MKEETGASATRAIAAPITRHELEHRRFAEKCRGDSEQPA
jgi:hypothetical protein